MGGGGGGEGVGRRRLGARVSELVSKESKPKEKYIFGGGGGGCTDRRTGPNFNFFEVGGITMLCPGQAQFMTILSFDLQL